MKKILAVCLILALVTPVMAADISQLGIDIPNIQSIRGMQNQSEQKTGVNEVYLESPIDEINYRIGPGDLLSIHMIIGDGDLTIDHDLMVGADGKIFFPKIGEIYLSGLNIPEAKEKINARIQSIYFEKYKLSVLLSQPKKVKVYLSGMVKNPGPVAVYDSQRVSEVIDQAGGVASGGSNRYVYIKRKTDDGDKLLMADLFEAFRSRDISKDLRVQAGDVIEVPDANNERISQGKAEGLDKKLLFEGKETFVYVYGEVAKSGRYEYIPGKKVSDYISYAGGPTGKALLNGVTLTRQVDGKAQKLGLNMANAIYNGNNNDDIEVLGGDVISVPGNFFYFNDFASFVNTVLLGLTLYNTVLK